jgi:hypothetical protein
MTSDAIVCTLDPARAADHEQALRGMLAAARKTERPAPQHLRLTLDAAEGLDIGPIVAEKQCCRFFDFTLRPTAEATVIVDVRVPTEAGPQGEDVAEQDGIGLAERLLDHIAHMATHDSTQEAADGCD